MFSVAAKQNGTHFLSVGKTDGVRGASFLSGGMLGWIILLVSAVFAAPKSLLHGDEPLISCKNPLRVIYDAIRWLNPFSSLAVSSNERRVSRSVGDATTLLDPVQLAEFYGYAAENHKVTTEDGYILGLHRLPSGRKRNSTDKETQDQDVKRPVILLHHAYLTSSREFLTLGPQKALAFMLADAGYDVWLCNARGNTYSREHVNLSPEDEKFWEFSFHEHGYYDLPAAIDYALTVSGQSKLHYLGYSMGTIAFFIFSSERPDLLHKVTSFTALGPLMTTQKSRSRTLSLFVTAAPYVTALLKRFGIYELLPHYEWFTNAGQTFCANGRMTQRVCSIFLNNLSGNTRRMNTNIIPELLAHTPAGSSMRSLEHFYQTARTGFRKFDFGREENMKRYDSETPPLYNMQAIRVPTQIFYSMNDLMADYTEGREIATMLPEVFNCVQVADEHFTHLDFIWAENAHEVVYTPVLNGIRQFDDVCPARLNNPLSGCSRSSYCDNKFTS